MDAPATWVDLRKLAGVWVGTGVGEFPTLDSFTYRERFEIAERRARVLNYLQETWRNVDSEEVGSHIETGFITLADDGTVEVLNAQGSDRVEVLSGHAEVSGSVVSIDLESVALANDERMISSWRKLQIDGDELSYTMGMATNSVPKGATHLTARLTRQ
jgi:hypothetical protein